MGILSLSIVLLFVAFYKRNYKIKQELLNTRLAHQEQMNMSNLETLENERKRFAQDLHDEIGASLSAIRLYISSIAQQIKEEPLQLQMAEVKNTIDQSMASARRISHNIIPPGLELMGLTQVMEDFAATLSKSNQIEVTVNKTNTIPKLAFDRELVLYRIFQEMINNTLKHAEATLIAIQFDVVGNQYCIHYTDNGKGFEIKENNQTGIGMSNINSRIKMLEGEMAIDSMPGNGFKASIKNTIDLGLKQCLFNGISNQTSGVFSTHFVINNAL